MGCTHTNTVRIGEVKCCVRCGYTVANNRKPFFDKDLINYDSKKERKREKKKC